MKTLYLIAAVIGIALGWTLPDLVRSDATRCVSVVPKFTARAQ